MRKKYIVITYAISFLIFAVLSPVAIFYAKGYRLDWQNMEINQTGSIEIDSFPRNAKVYLNQKLQEDITPTEISNLLPAEYQLRIDKEGFLPWNNLVEVEAHLVTPISHVLLLPEKPRLTNLIKSPYLSDFFFSWDEKRIIYNIISGEKKGIWILDLDKKISLRLDTNNYQDIVFSGDNRLVLAKRLDDYFLFNLDLIDFSVDDPLKTKQEKTLITNLSLATNLSLNKIIWHPQDNSKLFIQSLESLFEYNIDTNNYSLLIKDILTFTEADQKLYFIQHSPEKKPLEYSLGYIPLGLFNSTKILSRNIIEAEDYKIFVRDDNRLAYVADEVLYIFDRDEQLFMKLAGGITNAQWSTDLLYYNDHEIWVYYREDKKNQLINRLATTISNVAWWPLSKYVVFSEIDTGKIKFVETAESLNRWQAFDFYEFNKPTNSKVSFNLRGELLWVLDTEKTESILREIQVLE